jgi:hypothetical protein
VTVHPNEYAKLRAGDLEPLALPLAKAVAMTGFSRSAIYRLAAEGKIILLNHGRSTLVDMASARATLASLPRASIGTGR